MESINYRKEELKWRIGDGDYIKFDIVKVPEDFELQVVLYDVFNKDVHIFELIKQYISDRFFDKLTIKDQTPFIITGSGGLDVIWDYITKIDPKGETYAISKPFSSLMVYDIPKNRATHLMHMPQFDRNDLREDIHNNTGLPLTSYMYDVYVAGFNVVRFKPYNEFTIDET